MPIPDDFKGTVYRKITCLGRTAFNLKIYALCEYGEYDKRRKRIKIEHISVNNETTFEKFYTLVFYHR
jgi:hypothetical protein